MKKLTNLIRALVLLTVIGVLPGLATLWLDHHATVQFRRAVQGYNAQRPATSLRVGTSSRGLGVGITFNF